MTSGKNEGMYFIKDDFHNYIPWIIEIEAPPLDINQATTNVKNWFQSTNRNMKLDIEEVDLKQYDCVVNNEFKRMHVYMFFLGNPRNVVGVTMQGRLIELQPMK
ncbi:hypothetical protein J8L98_11925 [Pseudoalteromonas sp. MMG013]|uniref:hypothetical protein n=1 Tax=Pseudoalteromonas sp. MMG013 TaxID=2822687 RepID=UPI001B35BC79|nr:hypothetical protein [Pseudoalteromonas sp. MMG013]MBQ4862399.1 hypothetical protein [Pseudoalteromonas sp. MMG013]